MSRILYLGVIGLVALTFVLAYHNELSQFLSNHLPVEGASTIKEIVEYPESHLSQQLKLNAFVYQINATTYKARDDNGYEMELSECTKNRHLNVGQKQVLDGFILTTANPVFVCGVYRAEDYQTRLDKFKKEEELAAQALVLTEKQRTEDELRLAQEQAKKDQIELHRQELEHEYNLKLAKLTTGMNRDDVEQILGLTAVKCEYKSFGGADQCDYQTVINNTYAFSVIVVYKNGFQYQVQSSVRTI